MTYQVLVDGIVRDATPEEVTEIEAHQNRLPTEAEYSVAIQSMLDAKVAERRYDGIISACSYAPCTQPPYAAEGQACLAWRGAVWAKSTEIMDKVLAGTIPQPTIPELLAMLPQLVWPT